MMSLMISHKKSPLSTRSKLQAMLSLTAMLLGTVQGACDPERQTLEMYVGLAHKQGGGTSLFGKKSWKQCHWKVRNCSGEIHLGYYQTFEKCTKNEMPSGKTGITFRDAGLNLMTHDLGNLMEGHTHGIHISTTDRDARIFFLSFPNERSRDKFRENLAFALLKVGAFRLIEDWLAQPAYAIMIGERLLNAYEAKMRSDTTGKLPAIKYIMNVFKEYGLPLTYSATRSMMVQLSKHLGRELSDEDPKTDLLKTRRDQARAKRKTEELKIAMAEEVQQGRSSTGTGTSSGDEN